MAEVTIGCKLPNGLVLEIIGEGHMLNPAPPGKRVILKGANSLRTPRVHQGHLPYALTTVDKAFWDKWLAANKDAPFIRNGLVFVAESVGAARSMAKERDQERTGLEALDPTPKADPRIPRANELAADPDRLSKALQQNGVAG